MKSKAKVMEIRIICMTTSEGSVSYESSYILHIS